VAGALASEDSTLGLLQDDGGMQFTRACATNDRAERELFSREDWNGVWERTIEARRPTLMNQKHPLVRDESVTRSVVVPLIDEDRVVGAIAVSGRDDNYEEKDVRLLEKFAFLLAPLVESFRNPATVFLSEVGEVASLRKQLEEALRERDAVSQSLTQQLSESVETHVDLNNLQAMHADILHNSPTCIFIKDANLRYEFINRTYENIFNLTLADMAGKDDFEIFPKDLALAFRENDEYVFCTGEILQVEELAPHADGLHTYLSTKFPIRDHQGKIRAVGGIAADITDRLRAEQRASSLSRRLTLILDSVADGVLGLDQHGLVTFINPAAERLLGWKEKDLLGKRIDGILCGADHDDTDRTVESPIFAALREGVTFFSDGDHFRRKNGSLFPVDFVGSPIREKERVIGIVISFHDISERLARELAERESEEIRVQIHAVESIQKNLFPRKNPYLPGFDVSGRVYPANLVSGDFFDYATSGNGDLLIVVGDACGHDLSAAVQMVETRALIRAYLDFDLPMLELLQRVNNKLEEDLHGRFVSLFMARIEPESRLMEFIGAGHDAFVLRADGRIEELSSTGLLMGVVRDSDLGSGSITLAPGDIALLATDGIAETVDSKGRMFGRDRVAKVILKNRDASSRSITQELYAAVAKFSGGRRQSDDITAVVVKSL